MKSLLEKQGLIWNFNPISERSHGIFINSSLWASSPIYFNDPFEGNRDIEETIRVVIASEKLKEGEQHYEDIAEHLDFALSSRAAAYICFCRNASQTLMWSHYADEHRGIALGFKSNSSFCTSNKAYHRGAALFEIYYGYDDFYNKARAAITYSRNYYKKPSRKSEKKLLKLWKDVEYSYHFTKAKCWEYEKEVRLDADTAFGMEYGLEDVIDPPKGLSVSFQPDDLKAIVFGVSCTEDKMNTVRTIVEGLGERWQHVKIVQAKIWHTRLQIFA